ncbi:hypothetical protein HJC23_006162 [Cyclotella cryptica]|uniref:Uncharacterized protein n=1 Tax=Cyclotella cryptica TaxID=29204 RepID=A0ABD3Q167_9STRA
MTVVVALHTSSPLDEVAWPSKRLNLVVNEIRHSIECEWMTQSVRHVSKKRIITFLEVLQRFPTNFQPPRKRFDEIVVSVNLYVYPLK